MCVERKERVCFQFYGIGSLARMKIFTSFQDLSENLAIFISSGEKADLVGKPVLVAAAETLTLRSRIQHDTLHCTFKLVLFTQYPQPDTFQLCSDALAICYSAAKISSKTVEKSRRGKKTVEVDDPGPGVGSD